MDFEKATQFILSNARLLERTVFEQRFHQAPAGRILAALGAYQNPDGGFGNALEPDLRASESQPLFVEFALRTLYECNLRAPDLALGCCNFLERHADLRLGIPTLLPSSQNAPRADHWNDPGALQPSFERLIGLVGLANWQGVSHPWLREAVAVCFSALAGPADRDAHTLRNAFCLLESLPNEPGAAVLFDKLAADLPHASFFIADTPVHTYGLTPLDFAPGPQFPTRRLFSAKQIDAHLDELQAAQQPDGGWPIAWQPPGQMAICEWRGFVTVGSLNILRNYGRL